MRPLNVILGLSLIAVITHSCDQKPIKYEHIQRIVKAKTVDYENGNTRYNIAFTDGHSDAFSFGLYSQYEIGDTICWERQEGWLWYVIVCQ